MVVPTLEPGSPEADGSRWALLRTSFPQHQLNTIWLFWVIATSISASMSFLVIVTILRRHYLRKQAFNIFVIGLATPDFIFSFSCAWQCLFSYTNGHWVGGDLTCMFQSVYCIYGFATSIWMNVLISRELHRMAACPLELKTYKPPSAKVAAMSVGLIHMAGLLFSVVIMLPFLPGDVGWARGLACLPIEYDLASAIFHWSFTLNLMLVMPVLAILGYFGLVFKLLFLDADGDKSEKATFKFFVGLFITLIVFWLPAGFFIWIYTVDGPSATYFLFFGGLWSHVQGLASAIIYINKPDIRSELSMIFRQSRTKDPSFESPFARRDSQGSMSSRGSDVSQSSAELRKILDHFSKTIMEQILEKERYPMLVIELIEWFNLGRFPRSNDKVTRQLHSASDIVVFVSHRWWGGSCPDDSWDTKYNLLCHGLKKIIRQNRLDSSKVVVWCDWACIEQDDPSTQSDGIASLITYAARSAFVIIPVSPTPDELNKFLGAAHPCELLNYGERAWCRLETYMFTCVAEIMQKELHCYGYAEAQHWCGNRRKILRRFATLTKQASFDLLKLPSSGNLAVESDRAVIQEIEEDMRDVYARHGILRERFRVLSSRRNKCCILKEKQLRCVDMPLLANCIVDESLINGRLVSLRLDGNLLSADGVATVMENIVCSPNTVVLRELGLANNPLFGLDGLHHVGKGLAHPDCKLEVLLLSECALDATAVLPFAGYIPASSTLRLLDMSHNLIDDIGGEALLEACGGCAEPRIKLDIEGNRVSVSFFRKVARVARVIELGVRTVSTRSKQGSDRSVDNTKSALCTSDTRIGLEDSHEAEVASEGVPSEEHSEIRVVEFAGMEDWHEAEVASEGHSEIRAVELPQYPQGQNIVAGWEDWQEADVASEGHSEIRVVELPHPQGQSTTNVAGLEDYREAEVAPEGELPQRPEPRVLMII